MAKPSIYWLLVFVPIALGAELFGHQPVLVFTASCLAIVPLAGLILRSTDQLALHTGPRVGGLLNATVANVPELIIGVLLVRANEFEVVKATLVGSILGNLMLVLGASYLAGGIRFKQQRFSARSAGLHSASLLLAVAGMMMPAVFVFAATNETRAQVAVVSIAVASALIALYVASLIFTMGTHSYLFQARQAEEPPEWSILQALAVLVVAALLVGLASELLVTSLDPTVNALGISKIWVGLFVVAIVGNAAEHSAAVLFAIRNKMDVAIEIAFNSSTQIALFVAPLLVLISYSIGQPMNFVFPWFEVATVTLATVLVAVITHDGRSNWLEGLQLLGVYVIVAVSLFYVQLPINNT